MFRKEGHVAPYHSGGVEKNVEARFAPGIFRRRFMRGGIERERCTHERNSVTAALILGRFAQSIEMTPRSFLVFPVYSSSWRTALSAFSADWDPMYTFALCCRRAWPSPCLMSPR